MNDDPENRDLMSGTGDSLVPRGRHFLGSTLSNLPEEQRRALEESALRKQLDVEAEAMRAELRDRASSADMAKTVEHVRDVERSTRSDYTIRAEYHGASGRTDVEIKKSSNLAIIVIAVIIGVVVLIALAN